VITLNQILIPVDFSLKTDVAIKKAADLSKWDETEWHLLHVAKAGHGPKHSFELWEAEKKFFILQEKIKEKYPEARVKTHILQGHSAQKMIIECVRLLRPGLIIIVKADPPGRWSLFTGLSPDAIAKKSNCPVLTVKPGSAENKTKVIVLPVCDFVPERKLEWAMLLARKFRARVHLLAIPNPQAVNEWPMPQAFLRTYDMLRENLHQPVEYCLTEEQDTAKALLTYAREVRADLILANPMTESSTIGITRYRHLSDLLRKDSTIQVLDVEPYKRPMLSEFFPAAPGLA
jgi:nucleotide-binding universal stress UspA family protein